MDWKNRLDQIKNKLKLQLHAKGVDNLGQMQAVFDVSYNWHYNVCRNTTSISQVHLTS